jgi:hypothetical protein
MSLRQSRPFVANTHLQGDADCSTASAAGIAHLSAKTTGVSDMLWTLQKLVEQTNN